MCVNNYYCYSVFARALDWHCSYFVGKFFSREDAQLWIDEHRFEYSDFEFSICKRWF